MAAELPRPGVEIIQEFRAVTPTILTPTLVPCVVGVGKQIVDLLVDDGSGSSVLNSEALVSLQGFFVSTAGVGLPPVYGGLDTKSLVVSINNGPAITTTFADPGAVGLTPASVVAAVQAAFDLAGVTAARPSTVGDDTWKLTTIGVGEFQFIDIDSTTDAEVLTAFGIGAGRRYAGLTNYNNLIVDVLQISFPDPRGNLDELLIEADTIRAFTGTGNGGFRESLRDSAFLRGGTINDPAVVTGSIDLTTLTLPGDLTGTTLTLKVGGGAVQTVDFDTPGPNPTTPALIASYIEANTTGFTAVVIAGDFLELTSVATGAAASIEITGGTAAAILGLAIATVTSFSIEAVDDGNGDLLTSLLRFEGSDFTATPTAAAITGTAGTFPLAADGTITLNGGDQNQTVALLAADAIGVVVTKINAVVGAAAGGKLLASDDGGQLKLEHTETGTDSMVSIVGGTAVTPMGHAVGVTYASAVSLPEPGDELWIDGALVAEVSEVAPGGLAVDQLRVALQQTISLNVGTTFFIIAKNLPGVRAGPGRTWLWTPTATSSSSRSSCGTLPATPWAPPGPSTSATRPSGWM